MPTLPRVTLALFSVSLFACDRPPTITSPATPRLDFLQGPTTLPNIFRVEATVGFAVRDAEAGLLVIAGLPNPPSSLTLCGGATPFDPSSIQTSGELQGVLHDLRVAREISISVFNLSSFRGPCASTPFAVGQGSAMRTDNDLLTSLTRGNSFATRIVGEVSGTNGQRYHVNAESRMLILPDLTFKPVVQSVNLVPIGAP